MQQDKTDQEAEFQSLHTLMYTELALLPQEYSAPLILHHFEGHSMESSADALSLPLNAFCARLTRAKRLLCERMSRQNNAAVALFPRLLAAAKTQSSQLSPQRVRSIARAAAITRGEGRQSRELGVSSQEVRFS